MITYFDLQRLPTFASHADAVMAGLEHFYPYNPTYGELFNYMENRLPLDMEVLPNVLVSQIILSSEERKEERWENCRTSRLCLTQKGILDMRREVVSDAAVQRYAVCILRRIRVAIREVEAIDGDYILTKSQMEPVLGDNFFNHYAPKHLVDRCMLDALQLLEENGWIEQIDLDIYKVSR